MLTKYFYLLITDNITGALFTKVKHIVNVLHQQVHTVNIYSIISYYH
jgi:hypothetical protein